MECEFCGESFDEEDRMQEHWLEEHEEELNSHQKEKAKKSRKKLKEREEMVHERRKQYLFYGTGLVVLLVIGGVLGTQVIPSGGNTAEISTEGEPMIGNADANVTVVEFGDFQCPACRSFEQNSYSQLKENYIDTGQVKFYWKDYPLEQIHPWARTASETMECVYRQDEEAFWNVKSRLFTNQGILTVENAEETIIDWAAEEGVSESEIRSCLSSGVSQEVNSDITEGQRAGVTGTPSIYVNGKKLSSFSYSAVQSAVEDELDN